MPALPRVGRTGLCVRCFCRASCGILSPHTSDSLRLEVDDVDFTVIADQFNSPALVNEFGKVAALMCRFEVIKKKLATIKKT